jgi:acyl-CoA synthetase (AMP-forming)/AMP-acid ligase II
VLTGGILQQSARRHPDRIALICGERRIPYGALAAAASRFAHAVLALGIGRGDRIAIMSRNVPEYVIAHFGGAQTGAVLVNLMPAYAPDELATILERTAARLIVVEAAFQEKIASIIDRLSSLSHVVVIGEPAEAGWLPFDDFIDGRPETPPDVALSESDPFAMTFTGGTTGLPKGALVSHRARLTSAWTTAVEHEVTESDIVGIITPLYHAMGALVWLPTAMLVGATSVMLPGWDPDLLVAETARHGISCVFMVPVQLRELLSEAHFDAAGLASLRKVACGGAVTPSDLVAELAEKMPRARFTNHYGQSETGPLCIYRHSHPRDKAHTIGRPATGVDFSLLDARGDPVRAGETGEIVVRGPFLMAGYYDDPVETAAYFRNGDGWGWTGDLATMDEAGFVTLVGRSKDMIVSGGVNIYPREVERVLERHAAVADCTVFGIPDDKWGEALVAYIVLNGQARPSEDDIAAWCARHLARFKRPKVVRFVDSIPKTPSGKVQKPRLREAFLKERAVSS